MVYRILPHSSGLYENILFTLQIQFFQSNLSLNKRILSNFYKYLITHTPSKKVALPIILVNMP